MRRRRCKAGGPPNALRGLVLGTRRAPTAATRRDGVPGHARGPRSCCVASSTNPRGLSGAPARACRAASRRGPCDLFPAPVPGSPYSGVLTPCTRSGLRRHAVHARVHLGSRFRRPHPASHPFPPFSFAPPVAGATDGSLGVFAWWSSPSPSTTCQAKTSCRARPLCAWAGRPPKGAASRHRCCEIPTTRPVCPSPPYLGDGAA